MCCTVCDCLGYCPRRDNDGLQHAGVKVVSKRSFKQLRLSSESGCGFCRLALRASSLLRTAELDPALDIIVYPHAPTEIHSLSVEQECDVVEVYASAELNDSHCPRLGNDVPRVADPEDSLRFLGLQYDRCLKQHELCNQGATLLPKRVIDISGSTYRLMEPGRDSTGRYAAVSYSWGKQGFQFTTVKNYESIKSGVPRDSIPVVFQNAAFIARRLNIRYLWIDTMCIIQDNTGDWEEQVIEMAQIFENAAITIAASASSDPTVSIFGLRHPDHQAVELNEDGDGSRLNATFKGRRKIQFGIHMKSQSSTEIDPLDRRAWAFQEKALSTRLISFTGAEMQWSCRTMKSCECHHMPYPSEVLFDPSTAPVNVDHDIRDIVAWTRAIEEYSSRELTRTTDRLPALIGFASKFYSSTGLTYMAGLWKENLASQLAWQRGSVSLSAPLSDLAPSFSWVSVAGPVDFQLGRFSYDGTREHHIEFLEVEYTTVDNRPFSRAVDGFFTARGHTVAAHLQTSALADPQAYKLCVEDAVYLPNTSKRASCEFSIDTLLTSFNNREGGSWSDISRVRSVENTLDKVNGRVKLLSLYSIQHQRYVYENFLILGKSPTHSNSYERIGIGTGKLYNDVCGGSEGVSSTSAKAIQPFEWLTVDLKTMGSRIPGVVQEAVHVR